MLRLLARSLSLAPLLIATAFGCGGNSDKDKNKASAAKASSSAATTTAATAAQSAKVDPEVAMKAAITKKIAKLDAIAAKKLPAITTKASLKAAKPKPLLEGFVNEPNAAVTSPDQLPDLRLDTQLPAYSGGSLNWCAALARGKKDTVDSSYTSNCMHYRYVVLLRFSHRVNPKLTGPTTFKSGSCTGDATVFDFASGERLGAVPFSATNADKMEATQGLEIGRLTADLETQCAWSAQLGINAAYGEPSPK